MSPEHIAPVAPSVFEILALKLAPLKTTDFCLENRLSPEIRGGRNIFYYLPILLKLGRQNGTVTGYRWQLFGKIETPLTPPGANEFLNFDRSYLVNGAK